MENAISKVSDILEQWKDIVLRVRSLERGASEVVDELQKSRKSQSQAGSNEIALMIVEKMRLRNELRRKLNQTIISMQKTREVIEMGLKTSQDSEDLKKENFVSYAAEFIDSASKAIAAENDFLVENGCQKETQKQDEEQAIKDCCPPSTALVIWSLVCKLRQVERSQSFQADLLQAQESAAISAGYTQGNFAYGSTPYPTWRRVMASPPVAAALAALLARAPLPGHTEPAPPAGEVLVLGSSLGSLVLFAAATFRVPARSPRTPRPYPDSDRLGVPPESSQYGRLVDADAPDSGRRQTCPGPGLRLACPPRPSRGPGAGPTPLGRGLSPEWARPLARVGRIGPGPIRKCPLARVGQTRGPEARLAGRPWGALHDT